MMIHMINSTSRMIRATSIQWQITSNVSNHFLYDELVVMINYFYDHFF